MLDFAAELLPAAFLASWILSSSTNEFLVSLICSGAQNLKIGITQGSRAKEVVGLEAMSANLSSNYNVGVRRGKIMFNCSLLDSVIPLLIKKLERMHQALLLVNYSCFAGI